MSASSSPVKKSPSPRRGRASAGASADRNATHADGEPAGRFAPLTLPERRRTDIPGVWLNRDGAQVDEAGVLVSLRRVKAIEAEHIAEVLHGPVPDSPAAFLRAVALDPTKPLHTRISCAVSAAPYFDRKMPLALEGGDPSRPIKSESSMAIRQLEKLDPAERKAALLLLEKLGALPSLD
jgi:hypothetical protein